MYAKSIINSDRFSDMPLTAQALYFHLGIWADDEGFLSSPKRLVRATGCSEDDLKILVAKGFLICFDSGIVVITHWKIHNKIAKDRFKPTIYAKEKAMLTQNSNGEYVLKSSVNTLDTNCIQNVDEMDTQDRLGKDRIGKDSIGKDRLGEVREDKDSKVKDRSGKVREDEEKISRRADEEILVDADDVVESYNGICKSLPQVIKLTDDRREKIKAATEILGSTEFDDVFKAVESSDFLTGRSGKWVGCSFDWIIKPENLTKIIEGNYDDCRGAVEESPTKRPPSYNIEELEKINLDF